MAALLRTPPPRKRATAGSTHGPELDVKMPVTTETKASSRRTSASTSARKRLEYEAALKLAEIQSDLVKKKLELDLAEIESSRSSHTSFDKGYHRTIDEWVDDALQHAQDGGRTNGEHGDQHRPDNRSPVTVDDPLTNAKCKPPIGERCTCDVPRSCPPSIDEPPVRRTYDDSRREQRTEFQGHAEPQRRSDLLELAEAIRDVVFIPKKENSELLTRLATSKDLPVYSGDPVEWLQFKEAYSESTRICKFSDTENMWRLRKCLKGEAREAVASLLIGKSAPHTVMSTLELRFGRPEHIISMIVAQLRKLPPLSERYHSEIVEFAIKVQNFVTATKAIDLPEYLHSPELVSSVLAKLPTTLIDKWATYTYINVGKKSKFEQLSEFLYMEATIAATSGVSYLHSTHTYTARPRRHPIAHNVLTSDARMPATNENRCGFCRGEKHPLEMCTKFKRALRRDRWRYARSHKLCFKCLRARHADPTSCRASPCDVEECGQPHHRLLHWTWTAGRRETGERAPPPPPPQPLEQPGGEPRGVDPDDQIVTHTTAAAAPPRPAALPRSAVNKVLLKVVPITLCGPKEEIHTHALLDDGATISLISSDVADRAGLHGQVSTLRARSAWDSGDLVCRTEILNLCIKNRDGQNFELRARKIDNLNLPTQALSDVDLAQYEHVNHNFEFCYCDVQPKILIGQDFYDLIVPTIVIKGKTGEPYVTKTPLGWCVHGTVSTRLGTRSAVNVTCSTHDRSPRAPTQPTCADCTSTSTILTTSDNSDNATCDCFDLHEFVRKSFSLDTSVLTKPRKNKDEVRAIEILDKTSEFIDGRWYVGLPWKSDIGTLPDSLPTALRRLGSVEKKMLINGDYATRYNDRIQHLFENDYARELSDDECTTPTSNVWYLPHFGVDNPKKQKLRLVFDAAATSQGRCLNDYLLQGPDMLRSLYGILFRFRENPVGIIGDIKDMFLRIKIRYEDQNALRFLWTVDGKVKHYAMTSLIFGANCSPFIAQYVNQVKNASRFHDEMPTAVAAIQHSTYMDDYIDSLPTPSAAKQMVSQVTYIQGQGGFEMGKWASNIPTVLNEVPKSDLNDKTVKFSIDCQVTTLGLLWYPATDELAFDLSLKRIPTDILQLKRVPTKRETLRIVMSIFDVQGFLGPFMVKAKILLRDIWKAGTQWDDEIPRDLFIDFCSWITQLQTLMDIRIPRYYFRDTAAPALLASERDDTTCTASTSLELHTFCDASPAAYGAVAYWRQIGSDGCITVTFIASKSRVAPTKLVTIPRLELQGAVLACRLADSIKSEHRLKVGATYFWSDSTTVLHWIKNENRNYKVFIANRLGEIDETSSTREWHYVPTNLNPADHLTKNTEYKLETAADWFTGPPFLREADSSRWPLQPEKEKQINEELLERVHTVHEDTVCNLPVPDPARFSSWLRLLRATARMLMFIDKCRKRHSGNVLTGQLMKRAETLLFRHAQMQTFACEINLLKEKKEMRRDSRLLTLSPILSEDGLLRVGGRINAATDVPPEVRAPVILDGRNHIARLLVKDYHVRAAHGSNEMVVNELRQRYWVLNLRPTVRTISSQCLICRMRRALPKPPRIGDLPAERLRHHERPFTMCGLDLFGPMEVTVGRQRPKRYGVLFTCLTVRAIHIEVVESLTSDSLIMALRRMAARRGWPRLIYSDNGTNMRGASVELERAYKELDRDAVVSDALNRGVDWRFIPPLSPHMGGAWERLIRSVKTALKVVLKERAPKEETLLTLLTEVEGLVNSRPLTHVSVEPSSDETLTPNHFLLGSSSTLPIPGVFNDRDLCLRKQWRIAQRLTDQFWTRWMREILPTLAPRRKWCQEGAQLKEGDVVYVVDPSSPRGAWPKGVVQAVYPGTDGRVRVIDVKTSLGVKRRSAARVAKFLDSECCRSNTGGEDVTDK